MTARAVLVMVCAVLLATGESGNADPQTTLRPRRGIGLTPCARLLDQLQPRQGLANSANLAMVSWFQGYASAANIALLDARGMHFVLAELDESRILSMIVSFCKANPERRPVELIDSYIRDAPKHKVKWDSRQIKWHK